MGYNYYDTPVGHDVFKKLWWTAKYSGFVGAVAASYDVMFYSKPKGYLPTIGRSIFVASPYLATALTYTAISNVSASIRNKDDHMNNLIGGISAGTALGMCRKNYLIGFSCAVFFGILGLVAYDAHAHDWTIIGDRSMRQYNSVNIRAPDWTLIKERPRNWESGSR